MHIPAQLTGQHIPFYLPVCDLDWIILDVLRADRFFGYIGYWSGKIPREILIPYGTQGIIYLSEWGDFMDIRVLSYFLMVAREENITRAAQLLHITQPTLSRQLQQLEVELDAKLFRRSNHNIYLTNEGMLFRRRAQELVDLSEKAKMELSQSEEVLTGEVSIGCGELRSMEELAEIMDAFSKLHPRVKFHLHSGYNDDVKEWIEQGTLDMGLLVEPVDIGKYEFIRMSKKEEWGVLVRSDSPLAARDAIRPGDLVDTPLVTTRNSAIHGELASWSGDYARRMKPLVTYNLLYNAAEAVRQGMGAAVCIRLNCTYDGLVFVPMRPKLELGSILAWKERQTCCSTVGAFIQFAKKYESCISEYTN